MPRIISRAPKTPRKIRDIRPKRQLLRNSEKKPHDEDWWYQSDNNGGDEQAQLRGVAAVNRFRRPLARNSDPNLEEESDTRHIRLFVILKQICAILKQICVMLKHIHEKIRQTPRQERRKRLFWGLILITALRSIYLVDLDRYSPAKTESRNLLSSMNSMNGDFSSLKGFADEMPPSLFGEEHPKMVFPSTSMTSNHDSVISGTMGGNVLERGGSTTGMKLRSRVSHSDSILSPSQYNSRPESMMLGGNDYTSLREDSNQAQAFVDDFYAPKTKAKTPNLGGSQTQRSWTNSQTKDKKQQQLLSPFQEPPREFHHLPDHSYGKSLRGQSSLGKKRSMSDYDIEGFQIPGKYQPSIDNLQSLEESDYAVHRGGNGFDMNKDSAFRDKIIKPLGGIGSSQFSNQNNLMEGQSSLHHIPKAVHTSDPGLACSEKGGPFLESEYAEIVYWRDIPTDASFASPYYNPQVQEATSTSFWKAKYLTFEMDDAGWNNMRLGLENVMLLAHAMGRTLVMPPKRQIAHGMFDKSGSKVVSFSDFYNIDAINARQRGLNIIPMETFLEREALNGQLRSEDGAVIYPPNNQIIWDNQRLGPLWKYIRNVTKTFNWNPKECVLAFPAAGTGDQHLFSMMADVLVGKDGRMFPHYSEYQGRPVNVDAPPVERFREILAGRRKICMYDRKMHDENPVVHFKADQVDGTRLITQFYAFLWFEDWRHDLWSKRFVRDNLRYNNEIMCLSARIINALRNHARQRSLGNGNGVYDVVHVRRGDFQQQFPMTEMDASEILAGLKEYIAPGSTLFICTNERDVSFFRSIQEVYDVTFLGDFGKMLSDINPNYFPLVEQIVASRGRIFIGTFFSTFSAYIARLRGYYSVKEMHEGHINGGLRNTYFLPKKWKKEMHLYQAVHKPLYGRDFPVAWRDIDRFELPGDVYHSNM